MKKHPMNIIKETPVAGSLEPIGERKDWAKGMSQQDIKDLGTLSDDIKCLAADTAKEVVKMRIKVGRILLLAREKFAGDNEFGKWRKANTPITSRGSAYQMMTLAKQVGDGRITQGLLNSLSPSVLNELLHAPDEVIEQVEAQLESGERTTVASVREAKREASAPDPVHVSDSDAQTPEETPPAPQESRPDTHAHTPKGSKIIKIEGNWHPRTMANDSYDFAGAIVEHDRAFAQAVLESLKEWLE